MAFQNRIWVVDELKLAVAIVPKVACTSIKNVLLPIAGRESLVSSLHSSDIVPKGYLQLMPVRSPWERLCSYYSHNFQVKNPKPVLRKMGVDFNMSFLDFVRVVCKTPDEETEKHFKSQHILYYSPKWNHHPKILRFEKLNEWHDKFHLPELQHLRKQLITKPPFTREIIDLIGTRYQQDVNLFNYEEPFYGQSTSL